VKMKTDYLAGLREGRKLTLKQQLSMIVQPVIPVSGCSGSALSDDPTPRHNPHPGSGALWGSGLS